MINNTNNNNNNTIIYDNFSDNTARKKSKNGSRGCTRSVMKLMDQVHLLSTLRPNSHRNAAGHQYHTGSLVQFNTEVNVPEYLILYMNYWLMKP